MIAVYGAGAVGLVLGARLARAGEPVLFVTRRRAAARRIASEGVTLEDPASGESFVARAEAVAGPEAAAERLDGGFVVFCMRVPQAVPAAEALARAAPEARVASALNGVETDPELARRFAVVAGLVVRQTCTRSADNAARASGTGRLVLGAVTQAAGPALEELARPLRAAGYDVGLSKDLASDRWLKLCVNLMSAPNALVRREDHATRAFVELKARLLEEARDALAAAGIRARSCDGRDRSLDEEIAFQREALRRGTSARALPLYNQVWSALRHGGPLEADAYHRTILGLAARAGSAAPQNARVLEVLLAAANEGAGPESVRAEALLASDSG